MTDAEPGTRVQKLLATAGYGSRREIERWITDGRIKVNGVPCTLGTRAAVDAVIHLDGQRLTKHQAQETPPVEVVLYHKPEGELCTRRDPEGRPTVFDTIPKPRQGRWISVGRLDYNTAGLLLLTTDGALAERLMHPRHGLEREYAVRVQGIATAAQLHALTQGVVLEDGPACFLRINDGGGQGSNHWYSVVLAEGRSREVRRLMESQGFNVSRLIRVRFGPILLPRDLPRARWRQLSIEDRTALYLAAQLTPPAPPASYKRQPRRSMPKRRTR